jgi:hypothetical protein
MAKETQESPGHDPQNHISRSDADRQSCPNKETEGQNHGLLNAMPPHGSPLDKLVHTNVDCVAIFANLLAGQPRPLRSSLAEFVEPFSDLPNNSVNFVRPQ